MIMGRIEREGKIYQQILDLQEPGQFSRVVERGKQEGPKVFVRLPFTPYGIVEVDEVGTTGAFSMLIFVRVAGKTPWHRVDLTSFFYDITPHREDNHV